MMNKAYFLLSSIIERSKKKKAYTTFKKEIIKNENDGDVEGDGDEDDNDEGDGNMDNGDEDNDACGDDDE